MIRRLLQKIRQVRKYSRLRWQPVSSISNPPPPRPQLLLLLLLLQLRQQIRRLQTPVTQCMKTSSNSSSLKKHWSAYQIRMDEIMHVYILYKIVYLKGWSGDIARENGLFSIFSYMLRLPDAWRVACAGRNHCIGRQWKGVADFVSGKVLCPENSNEM